MYELFSIITEELRKIDADAKPLADGTPTGVWWYHRYLQGDGPRPKKYQNEEKMFDALAQRLQHRGITVQTETAYYDGRWCDLLVTWPEVGRVWIEVKCAWKHNDRNGREGNQNYSKAFGEGCG